MSLIPDLSLSRFDASLVVAFDMPANLETFLSRVERCRMAEKGLAVAFVDETCAYLAEVQNLLRETPPWFHDLR